MTVNTAPVTETLSSPGSTDAMIEVTNLCKEYVAGSGAMAVDNISFTIGGGELRTLLGPSGCGKTTTLRMLAGLERPTSGEIRIGGTIVYSSEKRIWLPANQRRIGMVFQSYAIWPHMSVFENVAFPLRVSRPRIARSEIKRRTLEALEAVGLSEFAQRAGTALSGGQQQRAVLARAIVREPDVLLLDEPLSNLDVKLRERMRDWIRDVQERTGLTTVFVTHDQSEALGLSDHISVMSSGHIVETASPVSLYREPADPFSARFVGSVNCIPGVVRAVDGRRAVLATVIGDIDARMVAPSAIGEDVEVFVRPEDLLISRADPGASSAFLSSLTYQGSHWDVMVAVDGTPLRVVIDRSPGLVAGEAVSVGIRDDSAVTGFPASAGVSEQP
ncbi:ABC transporter ATP-binding protein [Microcella alkalica]